MARILLIRLIGILVLTVYSVKLALNISYKAILQLYTTTKRNSSQMAKLVLELINISHSDQYFYLLLLSGREFQ